MKFTSEQRNLLLDLAIQHQVAGGADFTIIRESAGARLLYPNGNSVPCDHPAQDFYQLLLANLITFSPNSNGEFCGHVTERGILAAFGVPSGNSFGYSFPPGPLPKGTRAYEVFSDLYAWVEEHLALFHAELLESMPPESAPAQEFVDYSLNVFSGTFDIWVQAFSRNSPLKKETIEDFKRILDEIEKLLLAQASKARGIFIDPKTWPSEVKRRLNARKQYWIGHRLRAIREQHEQAKPITPNSEQPPTATPQPAAQATMAATAPSEALGSGGSAAETPVPAPGTPVFTAQRKRGPEPDYELAAQVAEVVLSVAVDQPWLSKLDDICEMLDDRNIRRPKTWKDRGYASWCSAAVGERSLVVKAITHHLELDRVKPQTLG